MSTRILIVAGSNRPGANSRVLCDIAAEAAREAGAEVRILDLHETELPFFQTGHEERYASPVVAEVKELAIWAQGFIIATPEYHGSLGTAIKNWFDWLYVELAGKTAGVMATTGGGGGDMSITAVKNNFNWCHGFTLPFHVAAKGADFVDGQLNNDRVRERVQRIAHDVVRYAPLVHEAFESAKELGEDLSSGFSKFHLKD